MPWHCLQGSMWDIRSDCSGLCTHKGPESAEGGFKSFLVTQTCQAALIIVVFSSSCEYQSCEHRPHVPVTAKQTVTLFPLASKVCIHPQYHSSVQLCIPLRWTEVACCMQCTQKELIAPLGLAHRLLSCSPHQEKVEGIHPYSKPQRQTRAHLRLD